MWMCSWIIAAIAPLASAEPTSEATVAEAEEPVVLDAEPEPLSDVTISQYRWLKPRRHLMEANPYQDVDFTSYALEWGEFKLGLTHLHFGVAPRVQIGTMPLLDLIGVYNGSIKANFLRAGPFDMAANANVHYLPLGEFQGTLWGAGLQTSVRIAKPLSIHAGANYNQLAFSGLPTALPPLISAISGNPDMSGWVEQAEASAGLSIPRPTFRGDLVTVRIAADLRLNRRDAFILQASSVAWARARGDLDLPEGNGTGPVPVFHVDDVFDVQKAFSPAESYSVTLSYQFSWKQLQLRAGGGVSAIPLQWALQANDVSWRFGGRTRLEETRARKGWREDKKKRDEPSAAPPAGEPTSDALPDAVTPG